MRSAFKKGIDGESHLVLKVMFVSCFNRCIHCNMVCLNFLLQIAAQWSNVFSVHVDDYLGCGTEQILLIFKDDGVSGQPLEHFIITDLCGISFSVRKTESGIAA